MLGSAPGAGGIPCIREGLRSGAWALKKTYVGVTLLRRAINKALGSRREKRAKRLLKQVGWEPGMSILDVGCGNDGRGLEMFLPPDTSIVGVDLYDPNEVKISHPGFRYIQKDARDLSQFDDNVFDVAVSIGMMEHICDQQALDDMANEMDRVAKRLGIIVPWRYAWLEPHFKFPFFQLLPYPVQLALTRTLNLHGLSKRVRKDPDYIKNHYQWFPSEKWQKIFKADRVHLAPTLETISVVKGAPDMGTVRDESGCLGQLWSNR